MCLGLAVNEFLTDLDLRIAICQGSHQQRRYILIEAPPSYSHQLRRLFPVCITVLWVLGSYTDRQLYCSMQQTEQSYRQGKVVSTDDDGGVPMFLYGYILIGSHAQISNNMFSI